MTGLERFLGELLWEKPHDIQIMRCKGSLVSLNEHSVPTEYILQGVDDLFEFREMSEASAVEGVYKHRLLFIGRGII
jgi:hypothetical protein